MIVIIVAYDENMAIGKNNSLPWHIPEDLKRFKQITLNKTIVMGRKTYESIGRPLPKRNNIVLTRGTIDNSSVCCVDDYKKCLVKDFFIIGGSQIYNLFLPYASRLIITHIYHSFKDTDTFFPNWNKQDYILKSSTNSFDKNYSYCFAEYVRKT